MKISNHGKPIKSRHSTTQSFKILQPTPINWGHGQTQITHNNWRSEGAGKKTEFSQGIQEAIGNSKVFLKNQRRLKSVLRNVLRGNHQGVTFNSKSSSHAFELTLLEIKSTSREIKVANVPRSFQIKELDILQVLTFNLIPMC